MNAESCETTFFIEYQYDEDGAWCNYATRDSMDAAATAYADLIRTHAYYATRTRKVVREESTIEYIVASDSRFAYVMRRKVSGRWLLVPFYFISDGNVPRITNPVQAREQYEALEISPGVAKQLVRIDGETGKETVLAQFELPTPIDALRHIIKADGGKWYIYSDSPNTRTEFIRDAVPLYAYTVQAKIRNNPLWIRIELKLPSYFLDEHPNCWTTCDREFAERVFNWLPVGSGLHRLNENCESAYVTKRLVEIDGNTGEQKVLAEI